MAPPIPDVDICYSSFQGGDVSEVPVIRIYGSTLAGQKTCLHIHRALPYLYVPCSDSSLQSPQDGHAYIQLVSRAMEKALKHRTFAGLKRQHVHGCSLVRAKKFYGFHSSEELFLKIYLYHPHEVARAASLLLGGAVLNRSFQPHESHFPYLLQFLVDYNLYGMGLIHLSKVKFRHPLPVEFIPRVAPYRDQCKYDTPKFTCASNGSQADSSSKACQDPAVWLSSTTSSGWMWPFPAIGIDDSVDQGIHPIKRQSTCELEGDATIDDILNQQLKIYKSLSQTGSEVKMVQSLVPIWEEENERMGVNEAMKCPDPSRPAPEYVLQTFLDGIGLENAMVDLITEAQNSPLQVTLGEKDEEFVKSIRCVTDMSDLHALEAPASSSNSHGDSIKCQSIENEIDSISSRGSLSVSGDDVIHLEQRDRFHDLVPIVEEVLSTEMTEASNMKENCETLDLLKWLASSQAMEDLSTDDELIHEAILSPLLPTTAVEKVLEKAHLEYEKESQQECQDILDSIKEDATYSVGHVPSVRSENTIPQVDGSFDDHFASQRGQSSEMETNNDVGRSSLHDAMEDTCACLGKQRRNQPLWSSLPFSTKQQVRDDLESTHLSSAEICYKEVKNDNDAISLAGNEVKKRYSVSKLTRSSAEMELSHLKEGSVLSECSLRDLMRRKRSYKVDSDDYGNHKIKKFVEGKQEEEMYVCPEHQASCGSSLTDFGQRVKESSSSATYGSKPCSEGFVPRSTSCDIPRYAKLFPSFNSSSLRGNASSNEHFGFEGWGEGEKIETSVGSKRFTIMGLSKHSEGQKLPESNNLDTADTTKCMDICKCCKMESVCSSLKLAMSDGHKNDLLVTGQLLKLGGADNEFVGNRSEQFQTPTDGCLTRICREGASLVEDSYTKNDDEQGPSAMEVVPQMYIGQQTNAIVDGKIPPIENCIGEGEDVTQNISSESGLGAIMYKERNPTEYIEMSFSRRPPTDLTDGISDDALLAPLVYDRDINESCFDVKSGSDVEDLPLHLAKHYEGWKELRIRSSESSDVLGSRQEPVLGVPTYYQNDGSLLYLLTPALPPPSLECVQMWLLQLAHQNGTNSPTGITTESLHEALIRPSSPRYNDVSGVVRKEYDCFNNGGSPSKSQNLHNDSSSYLKSSQGFVGDVCDGVLPGTNSIPDAKPDMGWSRQENNGNCISKINVSHTVREATEPQADRTAVKGKTFTENWHELSQISGPAVQSNLTPLSQTGFCDPASVGAGQQLTLLSIELQAESRGDLRPDPRFDAINIITLAFQEDVSNFLEIYLLLRSNDGESCQRNLDGVAGCKVLIASEERLLFDHFVRIIRSFDPDILMGWEIQACSLGYLAERAAHLGIGLLKNISRTPLFENKVASNDSSNPGKGLTDNVLPEALISDSVINEDAIIGDEWGRTHASGICVSGRVVLNIWRIMRSEIKLNMYNIEAVAEAVLRRKIPSIPHRVLTHWFSSGPGRARYRCIEHVIQRAKLNLEIMNQLDVINRTSELARVFGIDFFSVLSRGSQYRVESMFLRLAHTQNYVALSPGSQQVASQPAMECLPLVLEPESGFYADPVVVLDFQSLYPSMIIAYNLCYCTCLGNVMSSKGHVLGVSSFSTDPQNFMDLKDQILLTPNGVMYVSSKVRKGVLPRLLEEILSTRIMVKEAMKKLMPSERVLHRIHNARQLALKLIANVTYGYTAAGFSGRMPCAELADSIVQCGRRTLEKAISFVNTQDKWNARVIYGDTDSMFVLLKGRTMAESFRIGQEIASAVTAMNPNPVRLKMEKVYHPCVLLTKKRYVGYSYESADQKTPVFDAKGIETVRRDTCGAVAKTLEQSLRILFEHQDILNVKEYLQRQWTRILCGWVSLQDFVFSKEVRLGTYRATSLPPAALVATKSMKADPRAEPRYGERIPYVVIHGEPGARLVDLVVDPLDLLDINSPYRLNDLYYINKQIIPALQRVFGLLGADLNRWFLEMPRPVRPTLSKGHFRESRTNSDSNHRQGSSKKATNRARIDYYYLSQHCTICGELTHMSTFICDECSMKRPMVASAIVSKTSKLEGDIQHLCQICRQCGGGDWILERGVKCTSLACSIFYERCKVQKELQALSAVATKTEFYPRCMVEWF